MPEPWTERLHYSIECFDERGNLLEVLARIHRLDVARAAYRASLVSEPGKLIMLCRKAQILKRSDRKD